MERSRIYLDYAATSPIRPQIATRISQIMSEQLGNPSSIHRAGRESRDLIERARKQVATLLGATPEEILFTSGGTEANNLALRGVLSAHDNTLPKRLITSAVEHLSILSCARILSERGVAVEVIPVDETGMPRLDVLEKALKGGAPALVSFAYVNNETGNIFPLETISRLVKSSGGLLHVDAVQAVLSIPIDVKKDSIDFLSLSSHKLGGLSGTGALYLRKPLRLFSQITGGHQERDMRAGTENICGIVALGEAAALAFWEQKNSPVRLRSLRKCLEEGILQSIPDAYLAGHRTKRAPHIANVRFLGCEGQLVLINLDLDGICAASGSACATGQLEPSHVLLAMGVSSEEAKSAVRFSLGFASKEAEIEKVLELLPPMIARVREK